MAPNSADRQSQSTPPELEVSLDDFTTKTQRFQSSEKARRRWRLLKHVRMGVRRTSLTESEAELLKALSNAGPKESLVASGSNAASAEPEAATVARDKLKQSISRRRGTLTGTESAFLQALAEARDVSTEALENTCKVLEQDDLYNIVEGEEEREEDKENFLSSSPCSDVKHIKTPRRISQEQAPQADFRRELWQTKQSSTKSLENGSSTKYLENESENFVNDGKDDEIKNEEKAKTISDYFMQLWDTAACQTASSFEERQQEVMGDEREDEKSYQPSAVEFSIMGTSADDESASPQVLTPPLMDSLRFDMPYVVQEDNFWLKYSLMRDGAAMDILLSSVRSSSPTILAVETVDGEVFGSYTTSYWRHAGNNYYGSGESFLWRLSTSRLETQSRSRSVLELAASESEVEVFKWSGRNRNVQLSNPKKLIVGGGEPDEGPREGGNDTWEEKKTWGFGLAMNKDLSSGTSGNCVTFDSPSLTKLGNGGTFEVINVEVWTMTPVEDVEQAEKLELGRQFVFSNV